MSPSPGGVDIRLHRDGARHLVQCKNWRSQRVGVRVIREVYGVLTAENAQQAFVVCSGDFTADARGFAAGKPITLVDGQETGVARCRCLVRFVSEKRHRA